MGRDRPPPPVFCGNEAVATDSAVFAGSWSISRAQARIETSAKKFQGLMLFREL